MLLSAPLMLLKIGDRFASQVVEGLYCIRQVIIPWQEDVT